MLLQKFCDGLKNRSQVLKKLGHIDVDVVVQVKGRAICLIDAGDELLIMELMFNVLGCLGAFNDLDHHQVAALASCFISGEKSNEQIHLRTELGKPLQQLQGSARRITEIQREYKLEVNVEEYVESTVRLFFMDLRAAAEAMGEVDFESKFAASSKSLRRGCLTMVNAMLRVTVTVKTFQRWEERIYSLRKLPYATKEDEDALYWELLNWYFGKLYLNGRTVALVEPSYEGMSEVEAKVAEEDYPYHCQLQSVILRQPERVGSLMNRAKALGREEDALAAQDE
ncbi:hypothetical protein GIB67_008675 [Kingdonia uniflora]|uniref:ATP-dependent RNA helicase Ski2/MTR4 C-terminal domain-containing protein n=1 Tax=Kingdonia uniflora TaxID=39325 RepID=A0A7J7M5A3_9MAGN|nr:hypothetical protein GIB67_008675 [Kingdonia uniflora]